MEEGGTVEATAETEEKEDECRLESPSTFGCCVKKERWGRGYIEQPGNTSVSNLTCEVKVHCVLVYEFLSLTSRL